MIISFSGLDGSGKTTYSLAALKYIKEKKIDVKYMHMIKGSFYHLILNNFIGRFSKSSKSFLEEGLRGKKSRMAFFFTKLIKKILLFVNLIIFNIRYAGFKGDKKHNLICDRYFYDEIVQMRYLSLASERFVGIYKRLVIKPDIAFFIKVDPHLAFSRKLDAQKEYFQEKSVFFAELSRESNWIMLDAPDLEENRLLIYKTIEQLLAGTV